MSFISYHIVSLLAIIFGNIDRYTHACSLSPLKDALNQVVVLSPGFISLNFDYFY